MYNMRPLWTKKVFDQARKHREDALADKEQNKNFCEYDPAFVRQLMASGYRSAGK